MSFVYLCVATFVSMPLCTLCVEPSLHTIYLVEESINMFKESLYCCASGHESQIVLYFRDRKQSYFRLSKLVQKFQKPVPFSPTRSAMLLNVYACLFSYICIANVMLWSTWREVHEVHSLKLFYRTFKDIDHLIVINNQSGTDTDSLLHTYFVC